VFNNARALSERKERAMALASGTRLGPYEIVEPLGSGGMGEVYRARDPRLGRAVAIKLVATDGEPSPDRLRRFETEARAAAALSHPNVVTVFDVGTHDGHPYLVLELLEGETLRETLRSGVPALRQAVTWALEISRGLAAAHERGIVHRDLKPDNVFLTSDGRVKVLDFGLAKLHETLVADEADRESPTATKGTSPGVLLGTIGYMSPEQVKGQTPDARTDVFALGTVLYELVTGRKAFGGSTAPEVLASILRDEPPALESQVHGVPASLEAVVRRCLGKRPSDRFSSARGVEAALETVLAGLEPSRVSVTRPLEPRGPYPGLSSFTEADAGRFFGREAEVESLWAKLRQRKLLALIGPSGAGKTSFVRAGLVASRPSGWGAIVSTPGGAPMRSLAQALVEVLPSDADTMKQLLGFDDPDVAFSMVRKWRESHLEAVLVLDQFEELFTLNPKEVQERFAELLGRLVKEGDVHVLLSLRDDFLIRCHEHKPLEPVFQNLTPILALGGEDLRRALVEPAKREGFAFEDEALVAEMLESVQEARGALPLLAFAVARLWEKRDREKKLLTRKAYEDIGGVAGALALHAEQTLERIGLEREPLVRELFRNLVTAQWTRAVADREELLSVLPDREAGARVLDQLIDARLLTSYEVREAEGGARRDSSGARAKERTEADRSSEVLSAVTSVSRQRIEIVHESLIRAWPRLVRWQAQDEEGAVLRDQLKQAARLWEEKNRPDDLLWTGTSEREFELWRDRYPGKLTALEEAYADAMARKVERARRRRRAALAGVVAAALAVAMVTSALWRRSSAEARRAEAGKLLALAERQLEKDPTEALAYATASIELADTHEARIFATRTLWSAPPAFDLTLLTLGKGTGGLLRQAAFSPDGRWVALSGPGKKPEVWGRDGSPVVLHDSEPSGPDTSAWAGWTSSGLLATGWARRVDVWSVPEGRRVRRIEFAHPSFCELRGDRLLAQELVKIHNSEGRDSRALDFLLRSWRLPDGEPQTLGQVVFRGSRSTFAPDGSAWLGAEGREVFIYPLPIQGRRPRLLDRLDAPVNRLDVRGNQVYLEDASGDIRVWTFPPQGEPFKRVLSRPEGAQAQLIPLDAAGRWLATELVLGGKDQQVRLWDLFAPLGARPLTFRRNAPWATASAAMTPAGDWLAVTLDLGNRLTFWPVPRARPIVAEYPPILPALAFSPDSCWLAAAWPPAGATIPQGLTVRLSPLPGCDGETRTLEGIGGRSRWLGFDPRGRDLVAAQDWQGGGVYVVPLDGRPPRRLPGFTAWPHSAAVSPSGRLVATAWGGVAPGARGERTLYVWDVETEESRHFALPVAPGSEGEEPKEGVWSLAFLGDSVLLTGDTEGVRRWDLETGHSDLIVENEGDGFVEVAASADGQTVITLEDPLGETGRCFPVELLHLSDGATRPLTEQFGGCARAMTLDPSGTVVVTGDQEGVVRVGRLGGGEPHLLLGHEGVVRRVAISEDRRWIASAGDGTLQIWPMPDLDQPPIQTLPHDELVAKLESLTNIRVVRDPGSPEGWKVDLDPFPGWKNVPTWFTPSPEWSARAEAEGATP
jgi:serine/threonine protein kinase/WD40 repeat protein